MCLFVLIRTIVIFYTDLTIWIVHLRWPHMCVYPLATYVCLSTRHICVLAHSPHMGVYPLATYVCLSTPHIWVSIHSLHMCVYLLATYVCMYQVRNWNSNVIWFGSFLCSMIWCEMSSLKFVELFTITVYISLTESCIINW